MPVTTTVYIHDPVDYKIVFAKCAELTGASARGKSDDGGMISTVPDQSQHAWTWVEYGHDGPPLRTAAATHTGHCAPDCGYQHAPPAGSRQSSTPTTTTTTTTAAPGALHQRLVTGLGQWLDAQAVRWSWRNHGDGIIHNHRDGLTGLALLDG